MGGRTPEPSAVARKREFQQRHRFLLLNYTVPKSPHVCNAERNFLLTEIGLALSMFNFRWAVKTIFYGLAFQYFGWPGLVQVK